MSKKGKFHQEALSNHDVNSLAERVKEVLFTISKIKDGKKLSELTQEERQQIKEIYDESYDYYRLFNIFFGYRGVSKNIIQRNTENVWYDLSDETYVSYYCWQHLETLIQSYDASKSNFLDIAQHQIKKKVGKIINSNKVDKGDVIKCFSLLGSVDENGNYVPFEPEDVEANFSLKIAAEEGAGMLIKMLQKKIPGNKEKKKFILEFMAQYIALVEAERERESFEKSRGKTQPKRRQFDKKFPVKRLAGMMEARFGGKLKNHEEYIRVFRKKAQGAVNIKPNTTWNKDRKAYGERFFDPEVWKKNQERFQKYNEFKKTITYESFDGVEREIGESPVTSYKLEDLKQVG